VERMPECYLCSDEVAKLTLSTAKKLYITMDQRVEIVICLGSSCFSRGNKATVRLIDDWLKQHGLREKVNYRGNHCFSSCDKGPVLKIAETEHYHVSAEKAIDILREYFRL